MVVVPVSETTRQLVLWGSESAQCSVILMAVVDQRIPEYANPAPDAAGR